jgi:hypothetical protein
MSSTVTTLLVISRVVSLLNAALILAGNSEKYRALIASAVAEGRDITEEELEHLSADAQSAIDKLAP